MSEEKLTIEEIIAHCERVTKNYEKYGDKSLGDISNFHAKEYWEHRQVKGYLEELQKYREIGTLEELNSYMNQSEEEFNMLTEYLGIGTIEECRGAVEKQKEMIAYCDENDCSDCPFHNTNQKYNKCMNDFIADEIVKGGGVDE